MMPALDTLREFNVANADVTLWVFKGPSGPAAADPKYTGRWVNSTNDVIAVLRGTLTSEIDRLEEVQEYGLLAENNEASALRITANETHAGYIVDTSAAEIPANKVSNIRHLQNAKFYVAKFIHGDQIIYAVKKTESSWRTRKARSMQTAFFVDNQLGIDNRPRFDIARVCGHLTQCDDCCSDIP